jgi:hypothetical protein
VRSASVDRLSIWQPSAPSRSSHHTCQISLLRHDFERRSASSTSFIPPPCSSPLSSEERWTLYLSPLLTVFLGSLQLDLARHSLGPEPVSFHLDSTSTYLRRQGKPKIVLHSVLQRFFLAPVPSRGSRCHVGIAISFNPALITLQSRASRGNR